MNKCRDNPVNRKHIHTSPKLKIKRECCCIKEYNQLKNNLKELQTVTQTCMDKQPKSCKSKITNSEKLTSDNITKPRRGTTKTWFDVLRESPKKETKKKVPADILDEKHPRFTCHSELFKNIDRKGLSLLLDDEKFLKKLIEMNDLIQSQCSNRQKNLRSYGDTSITDDDKFKSYLGIKLQETTQEQREKQDLQAKALVKLLENMQSVSESSVVQRETLENLTQLVIQLREENKMLNNLKEVRIDLESRLSSLCAENVFLKKQLHSTEEERDKANHLLNMKEKEIAMLKKHITVVKGKIACKIDSGIRYDLDNASPELNYLEDTLASVSSNNHSFEALIRPASSSPTEEIVQKWKNRSLVDRPEEDSGIQSNPQENCDSPNDLSPIISQRKVLSDLKNNVRRTVEELQSDMKLNDVSLNLSDATYKLSSSSVL